MSDEWINLSLVEWQEQGRELFGTDVNLWRFMCPSCGHIQTRQDWLDLGMSPRQVDSHLAFTCIGRWLQPLEAVPAFQHSRGYGCMYIGTGIPNISPLTVQISPNEERPTFGFDTNK